jgi:putative cardiolipin synthase
MKLTVKHYVHKGLELYILYFCLSVGLLGGCSTLPSLVNRTASTAILNTGDTKLGRAISPLVESHSGTSGIYPLPDAQDAFAARALLAQAAERTLDLQYYIWHGDMSGTLLFNAVRDAADRGVRVRLLLDDHGTSGIDTTLAALDSHPNIEVRLFNPFVIRKPRGINYLFDFFRLNRRMHNKSFTADNQVTIIGGRNVGDEYFGATDGLLYVDLDVMAVGPVVSEMSKDFDRYWASRSSYPVAGLLPAISPARSAEIAAAASLIKEDPAAIAYIDAIRNSSFVRELVERRLPLQWAATRMISDDPAKGLGLAPPEELLLKQLREIIGEPQTKVDLVAPYFVPGAEGTDAFVDLAKRGVRIRILGNSWEATDAVAPVHAFYAKRRKALLKGGVELYELRRLAPVVEPRGNGSPTGRSGSSGSAGSGGSSSSSLHAKTFSVDGARVFIGSFHFDPRSAELNTELGFVIESPALAQQVSAAFDKQIAANAYKVRLSDDGQLYWIEQRDGEVVRYDTEPGTNFWQRAGLRFVSVLPIEWLL